MRSRTRFPIRTKPGKRSIISQKSHWNTFPEFCYEQRTVSPRELVKNEIRSAKAGALAILVLTPSLARHRCVFSEKSRQQSGPFEYRGSLLDPAYRAVQKSERIGKDKNKRNNRLCRRVEMIPTSFSSAIRPGSRSDKPQPCSGSVRNSNAALFDHCIIGWSRQIERRSQQSTTRVNLQRRKSKLEAFVSGRPVPHDPC